MSTISPKDVSDREFSRALFGYNTVETDEYINKLIKNYSVLYRENAVLEEKLADANSRLSDLQGEEEKVKQTLEVAKKASERIISEAYIRADDILANIKKSCDAILRSFRVKIERNSSELTEMREKVALFKEELFEKYRVHIELIEQLHRDTEDEELSLSPDEYVEKVVASLKSEISSEYGVSIEDLEPAEHEAPAEESKEESRENEDPYKELEAGAEIVKRRGTPVSDGDSTVVRVPHQAPQKKKIKRAVPSVMELLYEHTDDIGEKSDGGVQLMFDLDRQPDPSSLVAAKK